MPSVQEIVHARRKLNRSTPAYKELDRPLYVPPARPLRCDFVWVFWSGGSQNDELRWSMRSVAKNYQGSSRLIVVGDCPKWWTGPHIPVERVPDQPHRKYRDSLNKLKTAVESPQVAQTFVWMMDDIYFQRSVTFEDLALERHQGALVRTGRSEYRRVKAETARLLAQNSLQSAQTSPQNLPNAWDWATHLPHIVQKHAFEWIYEKYLLDRQTLLWEILYGHEFYEHPQHCYPFFQRVQTRDFTPPDATIINNSNSGWSWGLRNYLQELFPDPIEGEAACGCG